MATLISSRRKTRHREEWSPAPAHCRAWGENRRNAFIDNPGPAEIHHSSGVRKIFRAEGSLAHQRFDDSAHASKSSPPQPSDSPILVSWRCPEAHSARFFAIQTHLSRTFHIAVDSPGLRRSGSWSQIINQAQDFPEQILWHRHLGQLERDVPAMADHLGADLDQFLPQRRQ